MAVENDFLVFAGQSGANVVPQSAYAGQTWQQVGFASGIAQSAQLNKPWRQSSIMAAVLAQFIVANSGQPAIDDGTTATLLANFEAAITAQVTAQITTQATGRWLGRVIYATAGAFTETPPAGAKLALYDVNGAGGGGGGAQGTAAGQIAAGSGGGAGARAIKRVASPSIQTITVGIAGTGGAAAVAGTNGGTSSVGSLIVCTGGLGGSAGTAGTGGTGSGATGGTATGGDINIAGANGFGPIGIASLPIVKSGMGANSTYGSGGLEQAVFATGGAAIGNGAAGAGGCVPPSNAAGSSGGAGTPGIVIIDYFS